MAEEITMKEDIWDVFNDEIWVQNSFFANDGNWGFKSLILFFFCSKIFILNHEFLNFHNQIYESALKFILCKKIPFALP